MCQLSLRAESHLFALLVTFTILFVAAVASHDLLIDPAPRFTDANLLHLHLYILLISLSLLSYLRCHFANPGSAADWSLHRPDLLHPLANPHARLQSLAHAPVDAEAPPFLNSPTQTAFCLSCDAPKMERVHHCSVCNTCVLRFDHHCPWMGNCIGLLNIKFFLLFLLYTTLSSMYSAFIFVRYLMHCHHATSFSRRTHSLAAAVFTPIALAISLVATGAVGSIFLWNLWLASINQTGLENYRLHDPRSRVFAVADVHKDYSAGLLSNFRHVLGWNPVFWLLPVVRSRTPPQKQKI